MSRVLLDGSEAQPMMWHFWAGLGCWPRSRKSIGWRLCILWCSESFAVRDLMIDPEDWPEKVKALVAGDAQERIDMAVTT